MKHEVIEEKFWILESNNGSGWKVVCCKEKPKGGHFNKNWKMILDGITREQAIDLKNNLNKITDS